MATSKTRHLSITGLFTFVWMAVIVHGCELNSDWKGEFYDITYNNRIEITSDSISNRGSCIKRVTPQIYLFRQHGKFHCLLIVAHHRNLLFYKEVPGKKEMKCKASSFDVNMHFNSFVRDPVEPVACPPEFLRPRSFTWQDSEVCQNGQNLISMCPHPGHLYIKNRRCPSIPNSVDEDIQFTCLARWRFDRRDHVFVKMISNHTDKGNKSKHYRCVRYEPGEPFVFGISSKASCRSVHSISYSPHVVRTWPAGDKLPEGEDFETEIYNPEVSKYTGKSYVQWAGPGCDFPDTFSERLAAVRRGLPVYWELVTSRSVMLRYSSSRALPESSLSCLSKHSSRKQWSEVLVRTITDCGVYQYQCVKWRERGHRDPVVEVQLSKAMSENRGRQTCSRDTWSGTRPSLLFRASALSSNITCPFSGRYEQTSSAGLSIGCSDKHVFALTEGDSSSEYSCAQQWKHHESVYLLLRRHTDKQLSCVSLTRQNNTLTLSRLKDCTMPKRSEIPGNTRTFTAAGDCSSSPEYNTQSDDDGASSSHHVQSSVVLLLLSVLTRILHTP